MSHTFCIPKAQHVRLVKYGEYRDETPTTIFEKWLASFARWIELYPSSLASQTVGHEEAKLEEKQSSSENSVQDNKVDNHSEEAHCNV